MPLSILHPTDFSEMSESAFAHALIMAVDNHADLTLLHYEPKGSRAIDWHQFPSVRSTLERWGMLEHGVHRRDVGKQLGIGIEKVAGDGDNVEDSILGFIDFNATDILVMATHGRDGLPRWFAAMVYTSDRRTGRS
ncbi:MAG: universal stress protein [Planctomycetaceae bacterium]